MVCFVEPEFIPLAAEDYRGQCFRCRCFSKEQNIKIPAHEASATPSLHFWNLELHLTALAFCIIVEVPLEPKLEFEYG